MLRRIYALVAVLSAAAVLAALPQIAARAGGQSVLAVASGDSNLTVFVQLVDASGLADALQADGPYTLLAPTDTAFAKLGEGAVQEMLRPENARALKSFVNLHVIRGLYSVDNIRAMDEAETLGGEALVVDQASAPLKIGGAVVVQGDIAAENGILHIVDTPIKA